MTWREIRADVHGLGLYVLPTVSVSDFSIDRAGARQVAWFRVDAGREFVWGWVEHPDGEGRTQYADWADFRRALEWHGAALVPR